MERFEHTALAACKGLLAPGDRVIAAVSGGADSMALLLFLLKYQKQLNISLEAVHVDHRLRPASGGEAAFVAAFCRRSGVPLHLFAAPEGQPARSEDDARRLRYGFFERLAAPGVKIATAHTRSDQAETLLFRLGRGAGVRGAAGIPAARGCYVRPLLGLSRQDTVAYCKSRGEAFCTDESNFDPAFARNRIRLEALPALKAACPGAESALAEFCGRMARLDEYLTRQGRRLLEEARQPGGWSLAVLAAAEAVERQAALRALAETARPLRKGDLDRLEALVRRGSGAVALAPGAALRAGRGLLWLERPAPASERFEPVPAAPGKYRLSGGFCLTLRVLEGPECEESLKFARNGKKPFDNCADYDKIDHDLCLRTRRPGDTFRLPGRAVTKTLKKYFCEQGTPVAARGQLPLLAAGSRVVWLWGAGFAHGLAPGEGARRLLVVELRREQNGEDTP